MAAFIFFYFSSNIIKVHGSLKMKRNIFKEHHRHLYDLLTNLMNMFSSAIPCKKQIFNNNFWDIHQIFASSIYKAFFHTK